MRQRILNIGRILSRPSALAMGVAAMLTIMSSHADGADCPGGCSPGQQATGSGGFGQDGYGLGSGFLGFGLNYHLGYGYGGAGLGAGAEGGYPFYAGPGYPHEAPPLRRLHKILPYAFNGGPGYSPACAPHLFYEPVGPLVVDRPVALVDSREHPEYSGDYGQFTGVLPYPLSTFAPYASPSEANRRPGMPIEPSPLLPRLNAPPYNPADPYTRPGR